MPNYTKQYNFLMNKREQIIKFLAEGYDEVRLAQVYNPACKSATRTALTGHIIRCFIMKYINKAGAMDDLTEDKVEEVEEVEEKPVVPIKRPPKPEDLLKKIEEKKRREERKRAAEEAEKELAEPPKEIKVIDFSKLEPQEGVNAESLIELMQQRANQLLAINVGDVILVGDEELTVSIKTAFLFWEQGKKMAQAAIAEETKLKNLEKDKDKDKKDFDLKTELLNSYKGSEDELEAAREKTRKMLEDKKRLLLQDDNEIEGEFSVVKDE